jgi:hypothetical protein
MNCLSPSSRNLRWPLAACLSGSYSGEQASTCSACPANSVSGTNAATCACTAGYFGVGSGAGLLCSPCGLNTFSASAGAVGQCTVCPLGSTSGFGATTCQCSAGYATTGFGASLVCNGKCCPPACACPALLTRSHGTACRSQRVRRAPTAPPAPAASVGHTISCDA